VEVIDNRTRNFDDVATEAVERHNQICLIKREAEEGIEPAPLGHLGHVEREVAPLYALPVPPRLGSIRASHLDLAAAAVNQAARKLRTARLGSRIQHGPPSSTRSRVVMEC